MINPSSNYMGRIGLLAQFRGVGKMLGAAALIVLGVAVGQWSSEEVAMATAPTCADGGVCIVGDVGPGGGIVFYVQASGGTFACGSSMELTCSYLEAAPTTGTSKWTDTKYVFSGNTSTHAASDDRLGYGFKNTTTFVAQSGTANRAITISRAYRGPNGKTDWFLPSFDELKYLYNQRATVLGFQSDWYKASSGCCSSRLNGVTFSTGGTTSSLNKGDAHYVRPIRAFKAVLTEDSFSVTYNSQAGSAVSAGATTTGGLIASPGTPTRAGFVFTGWFAASSGGLAITFPYTHGRTADFTLYAQWSAVTYVVSFDGNGATGGSVPGDQTKTDGVNLTIASNSGTLTKTGYTFAGWNTAADGSGTAYGAGALYEVDAALSLFAQWTANSLTVTYNSQSGSAVSAGATVTGGLIASPGTPTRAGFVFTGWFASSSGGLAITFPYTHGRTADFTLYAQWVQASLYGLGSITRIGTITTTAGVGNTFAAETESSSVSLRYQVNGLPANTVIDIYLVNDLARARSLIAPSGGYVVSLVVAWLAADGTVPQTASGKPILMTITNSTIKAGAKTYAIIGSEATLIGTALVDGSVTVEIVEDPEIVVVNPTVVATAPTTAPSTEPTTAPSTAPRSDTTTTSPKRDAVKSPVLIPKVSGVASPIAGVLKVPAGGSVPVPKTFSPKVQGNGKVVRVVISPVMVREVPAGTPAAPAGAKVFAVGERIQLSQETPQEPASRVAPGGSKAMFGGVPIETSIQKSDDGVALMSAGPATVALAGFVPGDDASGERSSTGLTASASTPLEIATSSFIATTPVQVWLFSTPILLAETTVDENGNFTAAINLPSSLPSGNHTLQIQGFVFVAGGATEVTANIAISITRASTKQWSATFPIFSSSISPQSQLAWKQFAADQISTEFACTLRPTSPASRSAVNLQLFDKRMLSITTLLKLGGCTTISVQASEPLTKVSRDNRTWTVAIEPQVTDTIFMWVHEFSRYSSAVRKVLTTTWTTNVAAHVDKALACRVTSVEPVSKSRANTRLSSRRNAAMKTYLAKNGCDSVEFTAPIAASERLATRQAWTIRVSTS